MEVIGKLNELPDLHNYLFTIQSSYTHYTNPFRNTFIASFSSTPSLILHVLDFCFVYQTDCRGLNKYMSPSSTRSRRMANLSLT